MTVDELLRPKRILVVTIVPLVVLGIYVLVVQLFRLVRYDPVYFSDAYIQEYDTPESVFTTLEQALQSGDQETLAELQGLRWPRAFPTGNIRWRNCEEIGADYYSYLYQDFGTWERYVYHTIYIGGRWIAAPSDADFYLRSGHWVRTFGPAAILWWSIEIAVVLSLVIYRAMARFREAIHGSSRT